MPLIDDFSYQLGDGGVILNPDALTTPFVDIEKVVGLDNAPIRTTERDHEGTDGGYMDAELEKGRPIVLQGMAYVNDSEQVETFLDTLKENWAPSRSPVPFYLKKPGLVERVLFVKPLGCQYDVDSLRRVGCTAIQFSAYAEDPRIYTSTPVNENMTLGAITGDGFGFPLGFPFGFGVAPSTDDGSWFYNLGNRATPVVFTISGPVDTPRIINETASKTLKFNIVLATDEFLVVDTQARTVLLGGTANRRNTLEVGDWFFFQKGENFIRFRANAITAATLNVRYYHAWR
jgi:hypothetical protein